MADPRRAFESLVSRLRGLSITRASQIGPHVEAGVSEVVRRMEARIYQALTTSTPVQFGTARSGWTPEVSTRPGGPILAADDDATTRSNASARLAANQAKAQAIANTYRLKDGNVFISNPVPWIVPLNMGTSSQAPKNFVQEAIMVAFNSLR